MCARHRIAGLLLVLGGLLASERIAPAQGEADESIPGLRRQVVELSQKVLEARSRLEALQTEQQMGKPGKTDLARRLELALAEKYLDTIADDLEKTHTARLAGLKKLADAGRKRQAESLKLWREASLSVLELESEAAHVRSLRAAGQQSFLDLPLILCMIGGGALFALAIVLVLHERRKLVRRRLRGAHVALLVGALGLTWPAVALASAGDEWTRLVEERDRLQRELKSLESDIRKVEDAIRKDRQSLLAFWTGLLNPVNGSESRHSDRIRDWESQAMEQVRDILVTTQTAKAASQQSDELLGKVTTLREEVSRQTFRDRAGNVGRTAGRVGVCLGAFAVGPGLLWAVSKRARKQKKIDAQTCPRCLAVGTLQVRKNKTPNPLNPDSRFVQCTNCQHEFRAAYRKLPRLCFPTVGVVASGKTRWLLTTYLQIKSCRLPVDATLQTVPSLAEPQFDAQIERINQAQHTVGTIHRELPSPLLLHVEDRDPWGHNQGLINLFDFAGEMMNRSVDEDLLRARALKMDGFVLFLDPTQVQEGMLEDQRDALWRFYHELCDERKVDPGSPVRVPVAVCVSKLDMVTTSNPMGATLDHWLESLRESTAQPVSLDQIRERSKACEEYLQVLFQGWDVARELRDHFGNNICYFPMTAVGLHGLGVEDLSQREFEPFGLLEPLLWLLHAHGYAILNETPARTGVH